MAMPKATRKKTISLSWPPIIIQEIILDFMLKKRNEIVYIYTHIYIYIYIYAHICTHIHTILIHTHIHASQHMHPNTHSYMNLHTHKRLSNCNGILKKRKPTNAEKKTKEEQCA